MLLWTHRTNFFCVLSLTLLFTAQMLVAYWDLEQFFISHLDIISVIDIMIYLISYIFRLKNVLRYRGKAVLLIRNPFRAILSWEKHRTHGIHSFSEVEVFFKLIMSIFMYFHLNWPDTMKSNSKSPKKICSLKSWFCGFIGDDIFWYFENWSTRTLWKSLSIYRQSEAECLYQYRQLLLLFCLHLGPKKKLISAGF